MGRIEKIKRELIEEANKRILGEQEVQHGHHPHEDNIIIIDSKEIIQNIYYPIIQN